MNLKKTNSTNRYFNPVRHIGVWAHLDLAGGIIYLKCFCLNHKHFAQKDCVGLCYEARGRLVDRMLTPQVQLLQLSKDYKEGNTCCGHFALSLCINDFEGNRLHNHALM